MSLSLGDGGMVSFVLLEIVQPLCEGTQYRCFLEYQGILGGAGVRDGGLERPAQYRTRDGELDGWTSKCTFCASSDVNSLSSLSN